MNKRFIVELSVGIILLASILVFGPKGMAAFALLAIHPFVAKRKKLDEREIHLMYKIGNQTAAITLLASIAIFYFSDLAINGQLIGANWLFFVLSAFLVSHGAVGLVSFKE